LIASLALWALCASPAHALKETEEPQEFLLREAVALIQSGDSLGALTKIDEVINSFSPAPADSKKAFFCADGSTQTLMVLLTAANAKQDAVVVKSYNCFAYFLKGFALVSLKRPAEAGVALQKAAAMAPLNMQYINELAEWHKSQGQWQLSIDTFKHAISKLEFAPPDQAAAMHARSLRGVGFGLIELGKLDEAEASFQESLKHAPNHPTALAELDYIKQLRAKQKQ
jgi:tetratricopeptide (TPR) repeat protein